MKIYCLIAEEAKKQSNIEEITAKALPQVDENAQPQNMEDDWITNFFEKARLISDVEMQDLWSKILAGEANSPGTYSKRTVNSLGSLDKSDAYLFQSLCGFGWSIGSLFPLIYDLKAEIYALHGINFSSIKHLDEIGLVSFDNVGSYMLSNLPKKIRVAYYGKPIDIEYEKEKDNVLNVGHVKLSKVGEELAPICGSKPIEDFFDYVIEDWTSRKKMNISSPIRFTPRSSPT